MLWLLALALPAAGEFEHGPLMITTSPPPIATLPIFTGELLPPRNSRETSL